jgi:hypothetical protein
MLGLKEQYEGRMRQSNGEDIEVEEPVDIRPAGGKGTSRSMAGEACQWISTVCQSESRESF